MKPDSDQEGTQEDTATPNIGGDAIGDTAYSERFVLKILLKFANSDTLKVEIKEKSFEDDLCTLWDMTAERDVVLFLQKNDILNLLNFAIPVVESPRIIEIIIGIIGNMCCQKEVVNDLLKMDFLRTLLQFIKSDDSLVLIQLLRLVNAGLYLSNDEMIGVWLELFEEVSYSEVLFFMMMNSLSKDLLVNALENLNTICSYCNTETLRLRFFNMFVTQEALISLSAAFKEITVTQNSDCEREELERILVISLQIVLNLVGFDKSLEIFRDSRENVSSIIEVTMNYYENKLVNQKEMDTDLSDIVDSTNTICDALDLNEICSIETYFNPAFNIWKALQVVKTSELNGGSSFEEDDKVELKKFTQDIECPLSSLLCKYIGKCSESYVLEVLDVVGDKIEVLLSQIKSEEIKTVVTNRTANHVSRIKDCVDL